MTILCATDFSKPASDAVAVAAQLARKMGHPLHLLHCLEPRTGDPAGYDFAQPVRDAAAKRVEEQATALRSPKLLVESETVIGWADVAIVEVAAKRDAQLIVLGAVGHRFGTHWMIGSVAERVARTTPVPLLLVRDRATLDPWISGTRDLRLLICTDLSRTSDAAVEWLNNLDPVGTFDSTLLHVAYQPEQYARLGVRGPIYHNRLHPIVEESILREMEKVEKKIQLIGRTHIDVSLTLGKSAGEIATVAVDGAFDLVAVGTHQRPVLSRLWHGSVAHDVIHSAPVNILCIPARVADETKEALEPVAVQTIVAATDFTTSGNHALSEAVALSRPGAKVVLLNVVSNEEDRARATEQLAKFERPASWPPDVRLSIEIADGDNVARTICEVAERVDADLIAVSTHARSRVGAIASVAGGVIARTNRPVVIARGRD